MKRFLVCMVGALLIGALPAVAQEKKAPEMKTQETKAKTASGTVSAVSGTSLTIKGKEEMTFTIDEKTKVTAVGGSTKTREKKAAGEKTMITDFVGEGDTVNVTYHDMGTEKHAAQVRVTRKAVKK